MLFSSWLVLAVNSCTIFVFVFYLLVTSQDYFRWWERKIRTHIDPLFCCCLRLILLTKFRGSHTVTNMLTHCHQYADALSPILLKRHVRCHQDTNRTVTKIKFFLLTVEVLSSLRVQRNNCARETCNFLNCIGLRVHSVMVIRDALLGTLLGD